MKVVYSKGNYQAYGRPRKKRDFKGQVYIIGAGLSSLSSALFLIRDAHVDGKNIHILERAESEGGACRRVSDRSSGYILEGGRELDLHFEVLWDLLRSVPSLENPEISVLDEIVWLNEESPIFSNVRATSNRSEDVHTDIQFNLKPQAINEIIKLMVTPDSKLYDVTIGEYMSENVLESDFWMYWSSILAFKESHSVIELKRHLRRFIHDMDGIADQSALIGYKYTASQALIAPLVAMLKKSDVDFQINTKVKDVELEFDGDKKRAKKILLERNGVSEDIVLGEQDLLFIPIGGTTENMWIGSQNEPAELDSIVKEDSAWQLWQTLAEKDISFGNPHKFCSSVEASKWVTGTITTLDNRIVPYIKSACRKDIVPGQHITGGYITVKDSPWTINWTFGRQPQFLDQPKEQLVGWMYGLTPDNEGTYVKKTMDKCTGKELCMEWLYHLGVPESEIEVLAEGSANTVPVIYPFITAGLLPRAVGDRPDTVPEGAVNFGFIGQFARIEGEAMFTAEYAVRSAMEAVYKLMDVDRPMPEVWGSIYDVRDILKAYNTLADGRNLDTVFSSSKERKLLKEMKRLIMDTDVEDLLEEYGLIQL